MSSYSNVEGDVVVCFVVVCGCSFEFNRKIKADVEYVVGAVVVALVEKERPM